MVSMLVYNAHGEEHEMMRRAIRQTAASLTDEKWQMDFFDSQEQVEVFLKDCPLIDLVCYDVAPQGSIGCLERIRRHYQETLLLLIADKSMSPMEYIRPAILASSLLIRPITPIQLLGSLKELVEQLSGKCPGREEESLVIETREGRTYVPLSKIYYFEAREKKIYVRMKKQELTFYDTMEHLAERLPDDFVRCHRSFIVRRSKVQKVMLSKNLLEIEDGIEIPLSRSYKKAFKETE